MKAMPRCRMILFLALIGLTPASRAEDRKQLSGKELVEELRKGGHVIYFRHPATNPDQADTDTMHLDNLKAQRHLSDDGRAQAKSIGEAFRALKIPVGEVRTSQFYRAIEAG